MPDLTAEGEAWWRREVARHPIFIASFVADESDGNAHARAFSAAWQRHKVVPDARRWLDEAQAAFSAWLQWRLGLHRPEAIQRIP